MSNTMHTTICVAVATLTLLGASTSHARSGSYSSFLNDVKRVNRKDQTGANVASRIEIKRFECSLNQLSRKMKDLGVDGSEVLSLVVVKGRSRSTQTTAFLATIRTPKSYLDSRVWSQFCESYRNAKELKAAFISYSLSKYRTVFSYKTRRKYWYCYSREEAGHSRLLRKKLRHRLRTLTRRASLAAAKRRNLKATGKALKKKWASFDHTIASEKSKRAKAYLAVLKGLQSPIKRIRVATVSTKVPRRLRPKRYFLRRGTMVRIHRRRLMRRRSGHRL